MRIERQEAYRRQANAAAVGKSKTHDDSSQFADLERRLQDDTQLYASLLGRQKELRDLKDSVSAGVSVQALASVPEWPSSHNPLFFIVPAFLLFSIGSSLIAIALERLDQSLRSATDVNSTLGILCIALVPRLHRSRTGETWRKQFLTKKSEIYSEALWSIVVSLYTPRRSRARTLLITSSEPKEGKTTLAWSLAMHMAQFGQRAVVVDFDFRHSADLAQPPPTLSDNSISANKPLIECIEPRPESGGFNSLALSQLRSDPLTLFSGEEIRDILKTLKKRYDVVILDGPPVIGVPEARLLPWLVDQILFVIKWGDTRRDVAQCALNLMREYGWTENEAASPPLAVLTQVNLGRQLS